MRLKMLGMLILSVFAISNATSSNATSSSTDRNLGARGCRQYSYTKMKKFENLCHWNCDNGTCIEYYKFDSGGFKCQCLSVQNQCSTMSENWGQDGGCL